MGTTYTLRRLNGITTRHDTLDEAVETIREEAPDAYVHDEWQDGRLLVWADEATSENDDGSNAVAEILEDAD